MENRTDAIKLGKGIYNYFCLNEAENTYPESNTFSEEVESRHKNIIEKATYIFNCIHCTQSELKEFQDRMTNILKNDKELGFEIGYRYAYIMVYSELLGKVKEV